MRACILDSSSAFARCMLGRNCCSVSSSALRGTCPMAGLLAGSEVSLTSRRRSAHVQRTIIQEEWLVQGETMAKAWGCMRREVTGSLWMPVMLFLTCSCQMSHRAASGLGSRGSPACWIAQRAAWTPFESREFAAPKASERLLGLGMLIAPDQHR